jgi:uncharacterized protein (TIGR02284 family)
MNTSKTIEAFNSLIVINNDRIEGYRTASETIEDEDLQSFFHDLSKTSIECRKELINEVENLGGVPEDKGTRVAGKFFRAWMEIKAALSGNNKRAILNSCEYGEDAALETYKNILIQEVDNINPAEQDLLNKQYALLKSDHNKVKLMRNVLRAESQK